MERIALTLTDLPTFDSYDNAVQACGHDNLRQIRPICDTGDGVWYVDFVAERSDAIGYVVLPETITVKE